MYRMQKCDTLRCVQEKVPDPTYQAWILDMVVSSGVLGRLITTMISTLSCNRFPKKTWPARALHMQKQRGTKLVCEACKKNGVIPTDLELYTCQDCQHRLGNKHFNKGLLKDYKYHGRKRLVCMTCTEISAQRGKLLQSRFKASKVYCKCFCPMHRDRCPLVRVSPKPRWPGCDGYISEEDMKFLNSLVPRPAWWSKAWGRK